MPDLVGDNLVFRVLLDKADFSGADPVVQFSQIVAFIKMCIRDRSWNT